jgi:hypothetical protein
MPQFSEALFGLLSPLWWRQARRTITPLRHVIEIVAVTLTVTSRITASITPTIPITIT